MNESQKIENYCYVQHCIETIQSKSITQEWVDSQIQKINEYRQWFPNFSMIHNEVRDITFRQTATNTELILDHLIKNEFDIKLYLIFNQNILYLSEYFEDTEEDNEDIACMFERFSLV